jgi:hypothetical protein
MSAIIDWLLNGWGQSGSGPLLDLFSDGGTPLVTPGVLDLVSDGHTTLGAAGSLDLISDKVG